MNRIWTVGAVLAGMVAVAGGLGVVPPARTCPLVRECPLQAGGAGPVDAQTAEALRLMWLDEERVKSFYGGVIARFGEARPFANIVGAEARHAAAVETLMDRHGVARPSAGPADVPAVPATLAESLRLAAAAERENIALYRRLLEQVEEPDIRAVLEQLRSVSKNNHLAAFERAGGGRAVAGRGAGPGGGRGGRGAGRGAAACPWR